MSADATSDPAGAGRVAFLGLGVMGLPMAANLVEAGYDVAGYDVRPERSAALAEQGGRAAPTPAEAARDASILIAIPFDADQIRAALSGPGGAYETLQPGALVILMATVGPPAMRALAADIRAHGYRVVDTPVTGGVGGAKAGTLTVIAAGAPADLDAAEPLLRAMGKQIFRVGTEPGQAQQIKMVNQLLVGTHQAAAIEAMALAKAAGADLKQVYELLISGMARSETLVVKVATLVDSDFEAGSSLRILNDKDLPLALEAGRDLNVPLITLSAAFQLLQLGRGVGGGEVTDAQIIRLLTEPIA